MLKLVPLLPCYARHPAPGDSNPARKKNLGRHPLESPKSARHASTSADPSLQTQESPAFASLIFQGFRFLRAFALIYFTGGNPRKLLIILVGARGFEPPASWSRTRRSTKLSHAPNFQYYRVWPSKTSPTGELLTLERTGRVHTRRPDRRNQARHKSNQRQEDTHKHECRQIEARHAEQQAFHVTRSNHSPAKP